MKKALPVIIIICLFAAVAGGTFLFRFLTRVRLNDTYVNGNSAGNLYNAGLFCESNGIVFFSNPDDSGRLYSMNPDGSDVKKLCEDTVQFINADDHYIYYVRYNGSSDKDYSFFSYNNYSLCRVDRNGRHLVILDEDPCTCATLIGNYIYYLHYDTKSATTLYKIKIDGTERKELINHYVFTCSASGQYFYFNENETNGHIYRYDTATDTYSDFYSCDSYKPIVTGEDNIYYLDVAQNNALVHTSAAFNNPVTLTTGESLDLYNVYGSYIFYQVFDETNPRLCMIKNDGSGETVIAKGTYSTINVTSNYIYFTDFFSKEVFFTPTSNPGTPLPFHPGIQE